MIAVVTLGFILGTVTPTVAERPLDKAKLCYESLDYVCADQQLSIALRSSQTPAEVFAARELDLLLSFAWRDERRMQTAIQKVFELQPKYSLKNFPPDVRSRLEKFRPEPPKSDALAMDVSYRLQFLSPDSGDAKQWLPGEGLQLRAGWVKSEMLTVDGYAEWVRHYWRGDYGFSDAQIYDAGLLIRKQFNLGSARVFVGAGSGVNLQKIGVEYGYESLVADSSLTRWGFSLQSTLSGCVPVWSPLYSCAHVDPKLLIRVEKGQARTSYIFPIGLGLRYEYPLDTKSE